MGNCFAETNECRNINQVDLLKRLWEKIGLYCERVGDPPSLTNLPTQDVPPVAVTTTQPVAGDNTVPHMDQILKEDVDAIDNAILIPSIVVPLVVILALIGICVVWHIKRDEKEDDSEFESYEDTKIQPGTRLVV